MYNNFKTLSLGYLLGLIAVIGVFVPGNLLARSRWDSRGQVIYYQNYDRIPERTFYRIRPQRIPLRGLNDQYYERDNIYGFGASAAGRMSHFTKNLPRDGRIYY